MPKNSASSRGGIVAVRKTSWVPSDRRNEPIIRSCGRKAYDASRRVWHSSRTTRSSCDRTATRLTKSRNCLVTQVSGETRTRGAVQASRADQMSQRRESCRARSRMSCWRATNGTTTIVVPLLPAQYDGRKKVRLLPPPCPGDLEDRRGAPYDGLDCLPLVPTEGCCRVTQELPEGAGEVGPAEPGKPPGTEGPLLVREVAVPGLGTARRRRTTPETKAEEAVPGGTDPPELLLPRGEPGRALLELAPVDHLGGVRRMASLEVPRVGGDELVALGLRVAIIVRYRLGGASPGGPGGDPGCPRGSHGGSAG